MSDGHYGYLSAAPRRPILPGIEGAPEKVFTGNENAGGDAARPFSKDAFHCLVVNGDAGAVDPARRGTKPALPFRPRIPPGVDLVLRLRLAREDRGAPEPLDAAAFDACLTSVQR